MPSPNPLRIPADLTQLLSRQALSDYSTACGAAENAAEQCARASSSRCDPLELRDCRARVIAAEDALRLLVDDLATREVCDVPLNDRHRALMGTLVGTALDRLCSSLESSEEEILAAADRIQRLRALLDELSFPASS